MYLLPNLVIVGFIEIEILILISKPTWIPWKKLKSLPDPPYYKIFKIKNGNLQFLSLGYRWQKREKKNTSNCKAFCVSRKRIEQ